MQKDDTQKYWGEYTNLQKVKHDLIREYLNGWFPKLGAWNGRIVYFDTHAGRGRHTTGEYGSPLIALSTFINHNYSLAILRNAEVCFFFVERDQANYDALQNELAEFGNLHENIHILPVQGESFQFLEGIIANLKEKDQNLAPAFLFIDPYGFMVPISVLSDLMSFPRVELFINVIWRELDMALAHGRKSPDGKHAINLDKIFGSRDWITEINSLDFNERAEQSIQLVKRTVNAKWSTHIRMLGDNGATRYLLLHLTNHDAGRELMKDCMWKVCPDGGFYAKKSDNSDQMLLISPEPDFTPLKNWVTQQLQKGPVKWGVLGDMLKNELWRQTHLNSVIKELKKKGIITATQYTGQFSRKADPTLSLPPTFEP